MEKYDVALKPAAIKDLDKLRKYDATRILDTIDRHLNLEPRKVSRTRIKRLRGKQPADYRLRVGEFRVFYTVVAEESVVHVLRVLHKDQTAEFYQREST